MEKEILNRILSQLDDLKKEQLFLLLIVFFVFIVIQLIQAVYTSRLIDKYRNELKKKEMKFSVFNELQIHKLSSLFSIISDLKSGAASVYSRIKDSSEESLELGKWKNSYKEFDFFYSSNKYIIPKSIKELVSEYQGKLIQFNLNVLLYNMKLEILNSDSEEVGDKKKNLNLINKKIGSYDFYNESLDVMIFSEKIKTIIEEYFEELE